MLSSLLYISTDTSNFTYDSLVLLANKAADKNRKLNVHGFIFYYQKQFLQYLEGESRELKNLMGTIVEDDRHQVELVIWENGTEKKRFDSWDMKLLNSELTKEHTRFEHVLFDYMFLMAQAEKIADLSNFDAEKIRAQIWNLMNKLSHQYKIETQLRESEAQLDALFNRSPQMIWTHDVDGLILKCNDELATKLGYGSVENYIGRNIKDFIAKRYHKRVNENLRKLGRGIEVTGIRGHLNTAMGNEIPYMTDARPILDIKGMVDYILSSAKDITELEKTEKELQGQEAQWFALFNQSPDMIWIHDAQGIIMDCNEMLIKKLGYKSNLEIIGHHIFKFVPKRLREDLETVLTSLPVGEPLKSLKAFLRTKAGKEFPILADATPVLNSEGGLSYIIGSLKDITELEKAETLLKTQMQVFEKALESNMIGFWDWDMTSDEEYLSPTYKKLFGYEDHEIDNRLESWQKILHPDDKDLVWETMEKHVKSKGKIPYDNELRYFHKNGQLVWVWARGKVIEWDSNDNPLRMVGTIIDITRLKQLADSNKQLERFAYVASHDLQEPLRTVNDFIGLFREEYKDKLDKAGHVYLDFIESAGTRMRNLVKGILEYSKIQGRITHETIDLNNTIKDVVQDLQIKIDDKNADIRFDNLPVVSGNAIELHSLFLNLIGNALKFVDKGKAPKVQIASSKKDGKHLFVIRDNGIGIRPKDQAKIFDIFSRLHNDESFDGTGIGLAHCKRIVELHGGSIWVESALGNGSNFFFTINT